MPVSISLNRIMDTNPLPLPPCAGFRWHYIRWCFDKPIIDGGVPDSVSLMLCRSFTAMGHALFRIRSAGGMHHDSHALRVRLPVTTQLRQYLHFRVIPASITLFCTSDPFTIQDECVFHWGTPLESCILILGNSAEHDRLSDLTSLSPIFVGDWSRIATALDRSPLPMLIIPLLQYDTVAVIASDAAYDQLTKHCLKYSDESGVTVTDHIA